MFRRVFPLLILNAESEKVLSGRKGNMTRNKESSGAISITLKHQTPPQTFSWPGINVLLKRLTYHFNQSLSRILMVNESQLDQVVHDIRLI